MPARPDLEKLHFELYDNLHMPNIPARLGGIYHDLHDVNSSVSLNHTAGLLQRKTSQPAAQHIQPVYPTEILMLVMAAGGEKPPQTLQVVLNRTAVWVDRSEMSGFQNSRSCSFSIPGNKRHLPPRQMLQQCMMV